MKSERFTVAIISFTMAWTSMITLILWNNGIEAEFVFGIIGFTAIFITLFYLLNRGLRWTRWVLAALLGFFAAGCLHDGFSGDGFGLILIGLGFGLSLVATVTDNYQQRMPSLPVLDLQPQDVGQEVLSPTIGLNTGKFVAEGLEYNYPSLLERYKAMFIDLSLLFTVLIIAMVALGESESRSPVMIIMVIIALTYEPLLTAYSATIGQRVMKLRVRRFSSPSENVGIVNALMRLITKALLGWLSFITINKNKEHRAIHDFAGASVVVKL